MNKSKIVLEVEDLEVSFGDVRVLENISFELMKGDFLMILGPNGAGKSVLIKAILTILPYQGRVKVFGKDIGDVRNKIGYVPQYLDFDRSFPITVQDVVKMGLWGKKENNVIESIAKVLELVGMGGKQKNLFGLLSGGQMKRVLIARALVAKPKVIFLDEPLAGIDMMGEKNFFELMKEWHDKMGLTTIMISHDVSSVSKVANKVLCINQQRLCFGGIGELTDEKFEKTFGKGMRVHHH